MRRRRYRFPFEAETLVCTRRRRRNLEFPWRRRYLRFLSLILELAPFSAEPRCNSFPRSRKDQAASPFPVLRWLLRPILAFAPGQQEMSRPPFAESLFP